MSEEKKIAKRRGPENLNTPIACDRETLQAKLDEFREKHLAHLAGAHKNEFKFRILKPGELPLDKLKDGDQYQVHDSFSKKRGWFGSDGRIYIEENCGKNGPTSIVIKFSAEAAKVKSESAQNLEKKIQDTAWHIKDMLESMHGYELSEPQRTGKPLFEIMNSPIADAIEGRYTEGEHGQRIDCSNSCTDNPEKPTEHQREAQDTDVQLEYYNDITENDAEKGIEAAHRINNIEKEVSGLKKEVRKTSVKVAQDVAQQVVEKTVPQVAEKVGEQVGKEVAKAFAGDVKDEAPDGMYG